MRNLIECNNVIPNIVVITNQQQIEQVISEHRNSKSLSESSITRIVPIKEELTVDQVKELGLMTRLASSDPSLIAIIGLDLSSAEVQNMLLKSLEELSERFEFLIFANYPDRLLPTIRSRCTTVFLDKPSFVNKKRDIVCSDYFSLSSNSDISREEALKKIDIFLLEAILTNILTLKHILHIRSLVENNNIDPAMGLDSILLFSLKHSTIKDIHETKK